eukprot:Nk52_evm41s212 gene=Nk52_evmTU41s212
MRFTRTSAWTASFLLSVLIAVHLCLCASSTPLPIPPLAPTPQASVSGAVNDAETIYNVMLHCRMTYLVPGTGAPVIDYDNCDFCESHPILSKYEDVAVLHDGAMGDIATVGFNSKMGAIIVAWRGSSNLMNWINDFSFRLSPWKNDSSIRVHAGFKRSVFYGVQAQVRHYVKQQMKKHPEAKLFVTGHSLGGAQATLSALDSAEDAGVGPTRITKVIAVASPLVGNKRFADYYTKVLDKVTRVLNEKDTASQFPPPGRIFGYSRLGRSIYLASKNASTSHNAPTFARSCDSASDKCLDEDQKLYMDLLSRHNSSVKAPTATPEENQQASLKDGALEDIDKEKFLLMIREYVSEFPEDNQWSLDQYEEAMEAPKRESSWQKSGLPFCEESGRNYFTKVCHYPDYAQCEASESILEIQNAQHSSEKHYCHFKSNELPYLDY